MCISKNDYKILIKLYQDECTTELKSYSIKQLSEKTELSINKIRDAVRTFKLMSFIEEGAVNHNAKTYYITNSGIQKIEQLGGESL